MTLIRGGLVAVAVAALGAMLLVVVPSVGADMEAPTMTEAPTLDGDVETSEWAEAERHNFSAPRTGTSSVWLGYLDGGEQLAVGLSLSDDSDVDDDNVTVLVAPRQVSDGDGVEIGDRRLEVERDGAWDWDGGLSNGNWSGQDSDNEPGSSNDGELELDVQRSASRWQVEALIEIGAFEAGDEIWVSVIQADRETEGGDAKTVAKGSKKHRAPDGWQRTTLPGIRAPVRVSVQPASLEAAVGGQVVVELPSDADGGRLSAEVNGPGTDGFETLDSVNDPVAGENVFDFVPTATGSHEVRAVWDGDEEYANRTTDALAVDVASPSADGPAALGSGALRVSFAKEAAGGPAEWRYTNTHVRAQDGSGEVLELERLDASNSCREDRWVGFANTGDGPLEIVFTPPVDRAAFALRSPEGDFSADWTAYGARGDPVASGSGEGSCSKRVLVPMTGVDEKVQRVRIASKGDDPREVVDVVYPIPAASAAPELVLRADPSPIHEGGATTVEASIGHPSEVTSAEVTVTAGDEELATQRCKADPPRVWIDCPVDVEVPGDAPTVQASAEVRQANGDTHTLTDSLLSARDRTPPLASMTPQPMGGPPDTVVKVRAGGQDASGVGSIQLRTLTLQGNELANRTCTPQQARSNLTCSLSLTLKADRPTLVEGTVTDGAGNTATVGPKPVPVTGADEDGDGLPDDVEDRIGTSSTNPDSDGDGLNDGWEVLGVDRNGDGRGELDLAAQEANPRVKDLFLEVDWAEEGGVSHRPAHAAIQLVRNALAPHGIRLHVDLGQEGGPFDPARFDHGHEVHRATIDEARAGIYYHVIAGGFGGPSAGSGNSIYLPTPGEDDQDPGVTGARLLHELGHHLGLGHGGGDETEEGKQVVYTENRKPNYLSVMNDAYAWGVPVGTSKGTALAPTLAGLTVGNLDETSLSEPEGIRFEVDELSRALQAGPTPMFAEGEATRIQVRYTCPNEGPVRWAAVPGPLDWNCNGATGDEDVTADVNRGPANSGETTLVSRTDWDALSYASSPCPHFALAVNDTSDHPTNESDHRAAYAGLGLAPCPLHDKPESRLDGDDGSENSILEAPLPPGDVERANGLDDDGDGSNDEGFADGDSDSVVNVIDGCPTVPDVSQFDRDDDGIGDRCQDPPGEVSGLQASGVAGAPSLIWEDEGEPWGYNVYRIDENVTRLGSGFPTTTDTSYRDDGGSVGDRYIVAAVDGLAREGPASTVTASDVSSAPDDAATDGGSNASEEGASVPGPGAGLAALVAGAAAAACARRR